MAFALAAFAAAAWGGTPAPGRYNGRLCVTVGDARADCGPARVDVHDARHLVVRIADLAYELQLASSQVDVVLMHGTMQIDGFFANYEWFDSRLRFDDLEKRTRYDIELLSRAKSH